MDTSTGNTDTVVLGKPPLPKTPLAQFKERAARFVKQRNIQLGLMLLLLISVPLTITQSLTQQDNRQHADTKKFVGIGNLPPFNNLEDLENQLRATTTNGYKFTMDDYKLCPRVGPNDKGKAGWWDIKTVNTDKTSPLAHVDCEGEGATAMCGDPDNKDELDPITFFGDVTPGIPGTENTDPFFTSPRALIVSRWSGNARHSVANPHVRGILWNFREYIPEEVRAGGWYYSYGQDNACFVNGVYLCGVDSKGRSTGGGFDGWARAMGKAAWHVKDIPDINRECALAIGVMEVRDEWERTYTINSDFDEHEKDVAKKLDPATKNFNGTGFKMTSWGGSSAGGGSNNGTGVVNSVSLDKASCKTKTPNALPFSDITNATDKALNTAATCLTGQPYCTVRGFQDGTLRAADPATRAYVIAFIARYHVYVLKDWQFVDLASVPETELYKDIPKDYGLALEIYTAQAQGFLKKEDKTTDDPTMFNPDGAWAYGYHGMERSKYTYTKTEAAMNRGDFIKAVYADGITLKNAQGKIQLSACLGEGTLSTDEVPFKKIGGEVGTQSAQPGDRPAGGTESATPNTTTPQTADTGNSSSPEFAACVSRCAVDSQSRVEACKTACTANVNYGKDPAALMDVSTPTQNQNILQRFLSWISSIIK